MKYEHDEREFSPGERAAIRKFMLDLSLEDIRIIKKMVISHERIVWARMTLGLWVKWVFWIAAGVVSLKIAITSFYQGSLLKLGILGPIFGVNMKQDRYPRTSFQRNLVPAFFVIAIFAPLLWMAIDRQLPYTRTEGEIIPADPAPGDFVKVRWKITYHRACKPAPSRNVSRHVVTSSGLIIDYEPVTGVIGTKEDPGGEALTRVFQLPMSTDPGPAKYFSEACFACNPLQVFWPVCVTGPEVSFNVSEPKGVPK